MKNEIQLDGQLEVVDHVYEVEIKEKGDVTYLLYENEEKERVVLKVEEEELVMTRFSTPKSIMRFVKDQEAVVTLPTPIGIQHFVTVTSQYELRDQSLVLHYQLKQLDGKKVFATYKMKINWGEIKNNIL
ncbi:hypothetical protein STRDD10_01943 [Streptococcus sp. DD10]|nr:hypothetical protein STRDD10_01943 [Streptococcus sp. DD10]